MRRARFLVLLALPFAVALSVRASRAADGVGTEDLRLSCGTGAVELLDERCEGPEACERRTVRLRWTRAGGVLSVGEREREVRGVELAAAQDALAWVRQVKSDVGPWATRPAHQRTATTECGGLFSHASFLDWSLRERLRWARHACGEWSACVVTELWRAQRLAGENEHRFDESFRRLEAGLDD